MCAASLIASRPWSVIVTEADLPDGDWRTVLELAHCCGGPAVVVTSRLADERLWSEVLHLGGYDVLVQPFDDDEIARVLTLARQKMPGFPESSQSSHASLTQVAETCLYDSAA
jgi:DNA-binding response OmpR family regulator